MKHKDNWHGTQEKFKAWWDGTNTGRPLMNVRAITGSNAQEPETGHSTVSPEDLYLDVEKLVENLRNYNKTHLFLADAFPNLSVDIGPGSMAVYLGAEPVFTRETVWFRECVHDWKEYGPLKFDENNPWWNKHLQLLREARILSEDEFLINIPDIVENVDILSAMRGPQAFCFDMVDDPELIDELVNQVDDIYFKYYDAIYDVVKSPDGGCSYTAFQIWGPGRTAKVQCDFCALMSPGQFREFVLPSLSKQCKKLDYSLYHLDGPDAVKHLDALMEIRELNALQWTSGAGKPDGGWEGWYEIYDRVRKANKSLWVNIYDGNTADWIKSGDRLVERYGTAGLYLLFPDMPVKDAESLIRHGETYWK